MIVLMLGYFIMGILFLILGFFYHTVPQISTHDNLIPAVKNDLVNLYAYGKQIFVSHARTIKMIMAIMAILMVLLLITQPNHMVNILEEIFSVILFFLLVVVFLPQDNPPSKGFPIEIFGFIYSVVFMFYSAGALVCEIFITLGFTKVDMWVYGDIVTMISYVVCIVTLRRFMERDLATLEITFMGMIMMTALEFITYYGIGFFNGIKWYNPQEFEVNIFGDITNIINHGIYLASQSQILERSPMEIWGYIILNGTDILSVTVVLGYVVQKFFCISSKAR